MSLDPTGIVDAIKAVANATAAFFGYKGQVFARHNAPDMIANKNAAVDQQLKDKVNADAKNPDRARNDCAE